ncbi:uncharacterized protein Z520_05158 [Fonsecaea multimorphosa CBS 102226]|uniref:Uncharacterized protein n=1 Tax=Fonsecaea multimorphosa CBS 102226 TaxID=1442371 RepID=A0A0D2K186_9EURO|nr:uncharacterized protein Z520_05158 [Fonsecaea multimorphosa CBS 102226]KIX99582.1 hypothetical protein Z520_05158 [Fonsecaea multimorphosa CBS 102226]OAL25410.1 hypothetical protein AYO22_04893 [Fonsecaea multimorphosa]
MDSLARLVVALSSQSGDSSHIAGALILCDTAHAIVLSDPTIPADLKAFLNGAVANDNTRVDFITLPPDYAQQVYNGIAPKRAKNPEDDTLAKRWNKEPREPKLVEVLSYMGDDAKEAFVTKYCQANKPFYAVTVIKSTEMIAAVFKATDAVDDRLKLFDRLSQRLIDPDKLVSLREQIVGQGKFNQVMLPDNTKRPVVLLWSRYSGSDTENGHNPSGDSDLTGQAQLIELLGNPSNHYEVISIGHNSKNGTDKERKESRAPCDLGEFYIIDAEQKTFMSRATQNALLAALMERYPGNLYQLGQKTGGMDHAALIGMPTLYIEEDGGISGGRMRPWRDLGPKLMYCQAMVEEPPTFLGKAIHSLPKTTGLEPPILLNMETELRKGNPSFRAQWRMFAVLMKLRSSLGVFEYFSDLLNIDKLSDDEKNSDLETEEKIKNEQNPDDQRKLKEEFELMRSKRPSMKLLNSVRAASPDQRKEWYDEIQKINATMNGGLCPHGYLQNDLHKIEKGLETLIKEYQKKDTIIRKLGGEYIARP